LARIVFIVGVFVTFPISYWLRRMAGISTMEVRESEGSNVKNLKRGRGRPIGSGIRDDRALALVADKIIATNLRLKPSTAMRQVCSGGDWRGSSDAAIVARWLRKWRAAAPAALEAARERRNVRLRPVIFSDIQSSVAGALAMSDELKSALAEMAKLNEPLRQAMAEMAKSLAPTQALIEQAKIGLLAPIISKEFQDQMAAMAASLKNLVPPVVPMIPDLIRIAQATKARLH
jgi:hypothetical protein